MSERDLRDAIKHVYPGMHAVTENGTITHWGDGDPPEAAAVLAAWEAAGKPRKERSRTDRISALEDALIEDGVLTRAKIDAKYKRGPTR